MTDKEFLDGLKKQEDKDAEWADSAEYLVNLELNKEAHIESLPEIAKNLLVASPLMAAGGLLAGGTTYYAAKKAKGHEQSRGEEATKDVLEHFERKPPKGFTGKMGRSASEYLHSISKVFGEHPVKAALMSGSMGAASAYGVAKVLGLGK